ncbi:MAG: T9SS type B sorting domain-containing protein [Leptolyngbya sp. SIO3F4]|nr:T9SS type B sorting domain-containing protein [Leptolyngbya sp. SIO3F4]
MYTVYAEDVNGCVSNVALFTINLHDSLEVIASPDIDICPGESTAISAVGTGGDGAGFRFEWSPSGSVDNPFEASATATPNVSTSYIVKMTDFCGSPAAYDTVRVNIEPLPVVDFVVADTTEGCAPFDVTLINTTTPVQFATWTIGQNISASGFSVDITDLQPGYYDVTLNVRTPAGCESQTTKSQFLHVLDNPVARFAMAPNPTTIFNTVVQFQDRSSNDVRTWNWNFADFGESDQESPRFQFPADTGSYPVRLTVTTDQGCTDDTVGILRIEPEFNIYVPTAFTPNGDGLNDVFAPVGIGIDNEEFTMQVFNRWGQLVFETSTLAKPWDGRMAGSNQLAPAGSYVWKVIVKTAGQNSDRREMTGYINLVR